MFSKTFTLASLATFASAHMLMSNPVPYGKASLTNAPLLADGSDFPCKMRDGVYDAQGASNVYKQGSTQQLSFTGQAVHGGGSCQVSITTDKNPDKNSVWKVIKSIEGGCPAKGQAGNMGNNPDAEDPYKYDFTIPAELAAGDYTLAWTWFNKIGNREMYMNCAPLTVTGSGGSKDHLSSLPDMFVANIGNKCTVPDASDLQFPNPGEDVDRFNGATQAFSTASGEGCQATGAAGGGSGGSSPAPTGGNDAPAPTSGSGGQPTEAQPQPTQAPEKSVPGGVFITVSQPAASQPATSQPAVSEPAAEEPAATQAPPATTAAPSTPGDGSESGNGSGSGDGSGSGSPSGGFAAGTACTTEGEWNCIGGSSFQRCASGAWTATQQLSGGVSCTPGQAADIGLMAKRGKRTLRRVQRFKA
ncbi:Hypothetical protein NCS54_01153300 [Fusarium falciforme]|uniref:Hypothetical protein n=1 Tax=Fusarium falciforme TaxID=195108 RepID=UPI0022FFDE6F|nr:Hypothetical protein NCS54_01153300 [Fusarium falciforme]WAO93972.1 Hypothetical protein NCS54_01153300 [Fusarium falciforme]